MTTENITESIPENQPVLHAGRESDGGAYGGAGVPLLSFFAPIVVLGAAFALHGVFPFGDRQIMVTDFWQQYYPFLSDFWHKLRDGSSLLWSWTGAGVNYPAMIAYYLASPLNFIAAMFPHEWLRETLTAMLLVKIGAAGLFFALYLRSVFGRRDLSLAVFSVFYALCAFTMGYYWNLMWFDTFALLPLVVWGLDALVKSGRWRLYTVALALAVGINYYIGFFICLITAILFFVFCLVRALDFKTLLRRLLLIAGATALGLGMTAVLTLPAYHALQLSYSAANKFPETFTWYESFIDILGNFVAFTPPSDKEGLPNVYSGMLPLMLFGFFLTAKGVKWREKLAYLLLLAFLLISCNLNALNYIWHGFHFTNMIPHRFAFIVSFLLVFCAYRAFTLLKELSFVNIAAMLLLGGAFLAFAHIGPQGLSAVAGSAGILFFCLLVFLCYKLGSIGERTVRVLLAAAVLVEVSVNSYIGVETVRTTDRPPYPGRYEQVEAVLQARDTSDFSRTEFARVYSINDPSLYNFDGVSLFSSTVNVSTTRFLERLGLIGWESGNRYTYADSSPLTAALLDIRYMVARDGVWHGKLAYWNEVTHEEETVLLENQRNLPFAFLADSALANYTGEGAHPFENQNELFRLLTGGESDGELFTLIDMIHVGHENLDVFRQDLGEYRYESKSGEGMRLKWNYEAPSDGMYYAYTQIDNADVTEILLNGNTLSSPETRRPYLFPVGEFRAGDIFSLSANLPDDTVKGNAKIYVARFDDALFDAAHAVLAGGAMALTTFTDTEIGGTVAAAGDGLLYTSVPSEPGWRAYIDGVETEIIPLGGSMAMVPVTAGEHEVAFRYFPGGMRLGLTVTASAVVLFAAACFVRRRKLK